MIRRMSRSVAEVRSRVSRPTAFVGAVAALALSATIVAPVSASPKLGALVFAKFHHVSQVPRRANHVFFSDIQWRKSKAQNVRCTEITNDAACNKRLHDGVALGMTERNL